MAKRISKIQDAMKEIAERELASIVKDSLSKRGMGEDIFGRITAEARAEREKESEDARKEMEICGTQRFVEDVVPRIIAGIGEGKLRIAAFTYNNVDGFKSGTGEVSKDLAMNIVDGSEAFAKAKSESTRMDPFSEEYNREKNKVVALAEKDVAGFAPLMEKALKEKKEGEKKIIIVYIGLNAMMPAIELIKVVKRTDKDVIAIAVMCDCSIGEKVAALKPEWKQGNIDHVVDCMCGGRMEMGAIVGSICKEWQIKRKNMGANSFTQEAAMKILSKAGRSKNLVSALIDSDLKEICAARDLNKMVSAAKALEKGTDSEKINAIKKLEGIGGSPALLILGKAADEEIGKVRIMAVNAIASVARMAYCKKDENAVAAAAMVGKQLAEEVLPSCDGDRELLEALKAALEEISGGETKN